MQYQLFKIQGKIGVFYYILFILLACKEYHSVGGSHFTISVIWHDELFFLYNKTFYTTLCVCLSVYHIILPL
jgi:hypothetical protein